MKKAIYRDKEINTICYVLCITGRVEFYTIETEHVSNWKRKKKHTYWCCNF